MKRKVLFIIVVLLIMGSSVYSEQNRSIIFNNISSTKNALSSIGIGTLGDWKDDTMGGYMSITNYYQFDGINNIAIYFTGVEKTKANLLELVVNINTMSKKNDALKMLSKTVKKMFEVLKLTLPKTFIENIEKGKEAKYIQEGIKIEIQLDKSKIETWIIRLSPEKEI